MKCKLNFIVILDWKRIKNVILNVLIHLCISVVRRVLGLHQNLATALASNEAVEKQARGVSDRCAQLMEEVKELKVRNGGRKEGGRKRERKQGREGGTNKRRGWRW